MSSVTDYHADVLLKKVVGSVQGKVISSPLSAITSHQGQKPGSQAGQDKSQLALPGQVPGWSDLSVSPTFNLISLQEAQAQARGRSRTHTQAAPDATLSRNDPTTSSSNLVRLRTRTASAGSKTKLVISNPLPLPRLSAEDIPVAQLGNTASLPRSLKQKKSGFMRLFNGKEKDKPSPPSPPPIPPAPIPSLPRTPKISSARVPVPSLSPSLVPQSPLQLGSIIRNDGGENDSTDDLSYEGSIKQHGPPLSIVTQGAVSGVSSGGSSTARPGTRSAPPLASASEVASDLGLAPASAPPLTTTFPGLSLRPISTVFSAHFADHIMTTDSASSAQLDTPSTPSHLPPSPVSSAQDIHDENHVIEDDPYVVIQRLQEQIKSTRKAWQHQIWELEGQVRDLRAEIDAMRLQELRGERCILCGRSEEPSQGAIETLKPRGPRPGVVDRPRARTGVGTRFGAAT